MKNVNSGFTLIELIVCIAILGIVFVAAFGFMMAGASSYNSINNGISLQLISDLTMNHISDYTMDCRTGINFADNSLYLINKDSEPGDNGSTTYTVHVFELKDDSCIYYGSAPAYKTAEGIFSCSVSASDLLVKDIQSFSVNLTMDEAESKTLSAEIEVEFLKDSQNLTSKRIVALRNKPETVIIN